MNSIVTLLRLPFVRLLRSRYGNVAMIWALTASVVLSLVGVSIDFTRANAARQQLQNAADGAALVAERMADKPFADRKAAAEQYFHASVATLDSSSLATISIEEMPHGGHRASAAIPVTTTLSRLVTGHDFTVKTNSEADQEGSDLEIALILDITGSMAGQRIADLKVAAADAVDIMIRNEQTPYYSKIALVPYAANVNVGGYAEQVRGSITPGANITAATWKNGPTKAMTGATKANPVVITSANHGFSDGDFVRITGVVGMTQLNSSATTQKIFTVANATTNTFRLSGINGSSYNTYSSGGVIQKCFTSTCEVQVTANNHGLATNAYAVVTGVNGMTQINNGANASWQVTATSANTLILKTTNGPTYTDYTNGGTTYCTLNGCEYFRFTNASNPGAIRIYRISTCVTERTGADAAKDTDPATAPLGRNYPVPNSGTSGSPCVGSTIIPLTSNKEMLTDRIDELVAAGTTAGHLGMAWGGYLLSPKFASLWPVESRPAPAGSPHLRRIAIMMTDGAYNTQYCNGVIANNSGAGSAADRINCASPNGAATAQAAAICTEMKNSGISIYTIGFNLGNDTASKNALKACASTPAQALFPSTGTELRATFRTIATAISQLRLSK